MTVHVSSAGKMPSGCARECQRAVASARAALWSLAGKKQRFTVSDLRSGYGGTSNASFLVSIAVSSSHCWGMLVSAVSVTGTDLPVLYLPALSSTL